MFRWLGKPANHQFPCIPLAPGLNNPLNGPGLFAPGRFIGNYAIRRARQQAHRLRQAQAQQLLRRQTDMISFSLSARI